MKLYSYVVARDYGFGPNPFHGYCTLGTCKPDIRRTAQIGDWIIGTGSKQNGREGRLVYAMRVTEAITFDEFWSDARFRDKRPNLHASRMQAYGDNIYHRDSHGLWLQENSHHSFKDGTANRDNVDHDTQTDRVLVSQDFVYWGGDGPEIPASFRDWDGVDLCAKRGHKCHWPKGLIEAFLEWLATNPASGYAGRPSAW